MEVKSTAYEIGQTVQVSEKLRKRELIVEYAENPQYPEYIKFEAINDKCDILDNISPGDKVEVHFNLKGRPWTNKEGVKQYFNSLQIWKVVADGKAATVPGDNNKDANDNDLPF